MAAKRVPRKIGPMHHLCWSNIPEFFTLADGWVTRLRTYRITTKGTTVVSSRRWGGPRAYQRQPIWRREDGERCVTLSSTRYSRDSSDFQPTTFTIKELKAAVRTYNSAPALHVARQ